MRDSSAAQLSSVSISKKGQVLPSRSIDRFSSDSPRFALGQTDTRIIFFFSKNFYLLTHSYEYDWIPQFLTNEARIENELNSFLLNRLSPHFSSAVQRRFNPKLKKSSPFEGMNWFNLERIDYFTLIMKETRIEINRKQNPFLSLQTS